MGPQPRVVRMFCEEKGLEIGTVVLSLGAGDALGAPHLARNPLGQVPVLELDSGQCISETLAICEYLEEQAPEPALIGATAEARAEARMWAQRVQLNVCEPMFVGSRQGLMSLQRYRSRGPVSMPMGSGEILEQIARSHLDWLDRQMRGREVLCDRRFTVADALLYCFLDYGIEVGQPLDPAWAHLGAWFERVAKRPSAEASAAVRPDLKQISGSV